MNRRELEAHLRAHGCQFLRHGARHDMWRNLANGRMAPIPRHRWVKRGTVRSACRKLDVPLPNGF